MKIAFRLLLLLGVVWPIASYSSGVASNSPGYREARDPSGNTLRLTVWEQGTEVVCAESNDNGLNWSAPRVIPYPNGCTNAHSPSVVITQHRTAIAFIADAPGALNKRGGLYVYSSQDRGRTFNQRCLLTAVNNITTPSNPLLAVCTLPGSPWDNRLYILWSVATTRPDKTQFWQLLFAASDNGGQSFTAIPQRRLNWDDAEIFGATLDVAGDGSVTVSWLEHKQSVNRRALVSTDGGASFY